MKKIDVCRFGIKWNKKKEENKRKDLNLTLGKKIQITNNTFINRPF